MQVIRATKKLTLFLAIALLNACQSSTEQQQAGNDDPNTIDISAAEKTSITFDAPQIADSYWLSTSDTPEGWEIPTAKQSSAHFEFEAGPTDTNVVIELELHQLSNSNGIETTTQIQLTVSPVEEPPLALGESFKLTKGAAVKHPDLPAADAANLLLNDRDEPEHTSPSNKLETILLSPPMHAESFELGSRGGWSYQSSENETALQDSFSYLISDGEFESQPVTVEIELSSAIVNPPPVVKNSCHLVPQPDNGYEGDLSENVSNTNNVLSYRIISQPLHGTVELSLSSGVFMYRPTTTERGYLESFDYEVSDLQGASTLANLSMVVGAKRIMPIGDSITHGVESTSGQTGDLPLNENSVGYRKKLKELLQSAGYLTDFVGPEISGTGAGLDDAEHAGFSGWKAGELANGRDSQTEAGSVSDWLESHPTDIALLHAGTNDHTPNASVLIPLLDNLQGWSASNNENMHIFVASLVPQRKDITDRAYLPAFNAGVEALVPSYAPNAVFVDQYSALDWETDITDYDTGITGLHPNRQGYEKMAQRWFEALQQSQLLQSCP